MLFKKNLIMDDIVIQIVKNLIQSSLMNVLMRKILPFVLNLLNYSGPYHLILIYLLIAIVILFILYKIFIYFKSKSSKSKSSNFKISSILSNSSDYDLNPHKMEKLKNKSSKTSKSSKTKKILTTDLLSSY